MKQNLLRQSLDISRSYESHSFYENKTFRLQINELQTINKICRERNKLLERQIDELNHQLGNMHKINVKLLSNRGTSDFNDYEQVYTAVNKKELVEAYKQIDFLQLELEKTKNFYRVLLEDNENLKNKILQYRKYVAQLSTSQEISPVLQDFIEFPLNLVKSLEVLKTVKTLPNVFEVVCSSLKEIAISTSVYIVSPSVQKLYLECMKKNVEKIRIGKHFVIAVSDSKYDKPVFSALEQAVNSKFSHDFIIVPGKLSNQTDFLIQCCNPSKKKNFDANDEKIVNLYGDFACRVIKLIKQKTEENELKNRLEGIVSVLSLLFIAQTLDTFANQVDSHLARFFGFETAGIVFLDNIKSQFFIFGYSSKPGQKFGNEVIRLPCTMGITGEVFATSEYKIYEKIKQKAKYSPEIDNVSATGEIRQSFFICLPGTENNFSGVLQLFNKVTGKITQDDCKLITELSKILGYMIDGIAKIEQAMDLTTRMKTSISTMMLTSKPNVL